MKTKVFLFVAVLLSLTSQNAPCEVTDLLTPREALLSNGLRLLTLQDPYAQVLTFQVWYAVGTRNEKPGMSGISHFFEHMMFEGSKNFAPGEHRRQIEMVGGVSGGYVTWDVSVYTETLPAGELELCARLESDRMQSLLLTEESFAREKQVILGERRDQLESQALGRALVVMLGTSFESHPYRFSNFGDEGDIEAITVADVREFYKQYYTPNNATIVVCGPISHDVVLKTVDRHFGKLRKGPETSQEILAEPEQTAERRAETQAPTSVPILVVGYRLPEAGSDRLASLQLANRILVEGRDSRLQRRMVKSDQVALAVGGASRGRRDPGLLYIYVYVSPGSSEDAIERVLLEEVERLGREGPTSQELALAKIRAESELLFQLETVDGRAGLVGQAALVAGDVAEASLRIQAIRSATADDVRQAVADHLIAARRTLVWVVPVEGGGS